MIGSSRTEIGILNLTRFGDLVQTSPVTQGLRAREPGARIHLIVKRRFRAVAEMVPGVDCVHEIDGDALARVLCDPAHGFLEGYAAVREIVDELRAVSYDALYNLTHSRASSVLMGLLRARERIGFTIDRRGQRRVTNPWMVHVGTLVRARKLVQLNLVDAYLGAAGLHAGGQSLGVDVSPAARAFAEAELPGGGPLLAVQLGASQGQKTWSVQCYAQTLCALARLRPGLAVLLVGVPSEEARARQLAELAPGVEIRSLIGRTSVPELAAVLERCALLLTGDTGTMHLAAAVGTPTCSVFVGLGTPYETAAYAEGHVALRSRIDCAPCSHLVRCGRPACHDDMDPEWVAQVVAAQLERKPMAALPRAPRADLLITRRGEDGMLELVPQHRREPRPEELLALAYREVFRASFCDEPAERTRPLRRAREFYGIEPADWEACLGLELCAELEALCALGRRGERLAGELVRCGGSSARLGEQAAALREVDAGVIRIGRAQPWLAPLALALEGETEALPEADLAGLARESARNYRSLAERAAALSALLDPPRGFTDRRDTRLAGGERP